MCIFGCVSRKGGKNSIEARAVEKVSCAHKCISCLFKYCTQTGSSCSSTTVPILEPLFCVSLSAGQTPSKTCSYWVFLTTHRRIYDRSLRSAWSGLTAGDLRTRLHNRYQTGTAAVRGGDCTHIGAVLFGCQSDSGESMRSATVALVMRRTL